MSTFLQKKLATALEHFQRGEIDNADLLAKELLAHSPKSADALHLRGVIAGIQHRHAEAEGFLLAAVSIERKNRFICFNLAKALSEQGKYRESLRWHKKALELYSGDDKTWLNYGLSLNKLGDLEEAIAAFNRALAINDRFAEAYTNKGDCLQKMGAFNEALALHDRALELSPSLAQAWSNRGIALNDLKRHEEALASHDRSIELKPDYAEAWSNRGAVFNDLKQREEALANYERAIELKPNYAEAWYNRGAVLNDLKRYDEALSSYNRAIAVQPEYDEAIFNKGLIQLSQKNFLGGFESYQRRREMKSFSGPPLDTGLPLCNRDSIGGNLVLWAEQGIGDEIFYAGMLTKALEYFSNITLEADKRLHPVLNRSFPTLTLLERSKPFHLDSLAKMDFQASIGDLGYILKMGSDAITLTRTPYLLADKDKTSQFGLRAPFTCGKVTCGLAWRSRNKNLGEEKSIDLEQLEPILQNTQLEFINLQYGEVDAEIQQVRSRFGVNIHQIEGLDVYNDIDGLLALIDACDIVITTSNLTAHLAGSIGKKTCVLIPHSKGKIWYWHLDDAYSFWYPSLKTLYQGNKDNWADTILEAKTWVERDVLWKQ